MPAPPTKKTASAPAATAGAAAATPEARSDARIPDIDRCIQTGIFEQTFSGAACIASVGGKIFHRGIYGCPTLPPPVKKLGFDALFDLASLTKPLGTGLATLVLASQNRIDLNASVAKTIPELKDPRFQAITIDMLLEHTAGFPAFRSFWQDLLQEEEKKAESERTLGTRKAVPYFRKALADCTLEHAPGTKTVYSDIGFMLLALIVEGICGKPLDVFLARDVYRLLGLQDDLFFVRLDDEHTRSRLRKRTFVATEECQWRKKVLQGEVHDPNAWGMGGVAGHAGLFGTVDAVWTLVKALWESYKGDSRVFHNGTVRRFWTRSKRLRDTTRTLAWDTPSAHDSQAGKRFSLTSVGHLGFTGTSIWVDLSTDIIGVVLTNSVHPSVEGKKEKLAKFRPRLYELIAKHGESLPADPSRKTGAAAFYSGPIIGTTVPFKNPLGGPKK
ncbi:MAG: serine hydrolase [Deltaproteobacteria bacterium]|nr:serine hydrolase [Deltaproteobacteria bacterium]